MENSFSSKALEVNLAETRYKETVIPGEHLWFMSLSSSHWGIHKRTQDFILEYNHQYVNYEYVIDNLHDISLTDFWFYNACEEPGRALMVIVGIFDNLVSIELKQSSREKLILNLLKFADQLSRQEKIHEQILSLCLTILRNGIRKDETIYIQNSNYFKIYLSRTACIPLFSQEVFDLTRSLVQRSIDFWESSSNMEQWFEEKKSLFQGKYDGITPLIGRSFFSEQREKLKNAESWEDFKDILFFNDMADHFRNSISSFSTALEKIYYIFYLLHLPGMSGFKDHLLYDMNRLLKNIFRELDSTRIISFITSLIGLFEELKLQHRGTVLDCISTLGKEVIDTGDRNIISFYIRELINFGFVNPGKMSVNEDWQIRVNPNHLKNLRVWLELIEYSPSTLKELLSALIVNLKLGGIFIADTDLFQRDVTKLLNSNIEPVYKQIKQLARIFPVYFREIGAEGRLREVTTALDELSHRKDRLIHFLRKQIHTESNNTQIELTKKIIQFWYSGNLESLKEFVPHDVLDSVDLSGEWFTDVHKITIELCGKMGRNPTGLFEMGPDELEEAINGLGIQNERDRQRLLYLVELYGLILEKYSLESGNIVAILKSSRFFRDREIGELRSALDSRDPKPALVKLFGFMHKLKQVILNPESSEPLENIYYKRHVAFGIPSMYGQYLEPKFEALGLMFRLEKVVSRLMEKMVTPINLEYMNAKTLRHIYNILALFQGGLELDGIENQGFNSNLQMLKYGLASPNFSLDQYINIFRFMAQNIKEIINEYFLRVYDQALKIVAPQIFCTDKGLSQSEIKQTVQKQSEIFYREILSSAFLIQQLDSFIANIVISLQAMSDSYSDNFIKKMMSYDPDMIVSPLHIQTLELDNPVFIGAKAYYLKKLISYGFPVPPGFILTTQLFGHRDTILEHPYINQEIDQLIMNQIGELEKITSLQFGNPERPLLLSVRSGTAISMPGAMSTFLNVGMNDEIVEALSRQPNFGWTSWDCYRRFIQSWGMSCGIDRDIFDRIILNYKIKYGAEQKIQFTPSQMKNIALSYKEVLDSYNIHIEKDPFLQLKQAIINVIDSWSSLRARSYREHLQIAGEWGTAVIVQKMVLGNISERSGSGVIFTHDPKQNKPGVNLYGDFTLCSQGEDIVSGLVHTLPVTEEQRKEQYNGSSISLEHTFPRVYKRLLDLSSELIDKYGFNHQEVEFTFESDSAEDLYILQTRDQKISKSDKYPVFSTPAEKMHLLGRGIGIGGGALCGILSFDMEDLKDSISRYPEKRHIIVRPDTVPDDIPMIFICDGLITGKGGATSHAAVTAASLDKVCIVNCKDLYVNEENRECTIGGVTFKSGDTLSIDGRLGNIYMGHSPIEYV